MSLKSLVSFETIGQEVEENGSGDFEALPNHDNTFFITSAETKESDNSKAVYVEVISEITGDKYKNRKIYSNFYLIKNNGEENTVARVMYFALCKACGIEEIEDMYEPANLLQQQYSGSVKFIKGTAEFPKDKNEIKNPKAIGSTSGASASKQSAPAEI